MPNHFISLDAAIEMTALYRQQMDQLLADRFKGQKILTVCETLPREAFDALLREPGCASLRIYYGMSPDLKMHAIIVGVNADNEDLLPAAAAVANDDPVTVIVEESFRCPDDCPPKSPLNP